MLKLRGRDLLPAVLLPLLKRPMHMAHVTALGALSGAASRDIHTFAHKIVPVVAAELAVLDAKACSNDEVGGLDCGETARARVYLSFVRCYEESVVSPHT